MFNWLSRTKSATELMKERKDREFIEALKEMAITVVDGRLTNHGLSEYGADKLYKSGRQPHPTEYNVLLKDGTFITYEEYKSRRESE